MAKTANLYVRIEPNVKEKAEEILATLGIPASNAINMFYKQIILQRGLPFEVKIPSDSVQDASSLTLAQMDHELDKGYQQMLEGNIQPAKAVFARIREDVQ